jgi:hypothetical protein
MLDIAEKCKIIKQGGKFHAPFGILKAFKIFAGLNNSDTVKITRCVPLP